MGHGLGPGAVLAVQPPQQPGRIIDVGGGGQSFIQIREDIGVVVQVSLHEAHVNIAYALLG